MRILGFDTATRATAAALRDDAHDLTLEARDDPAAGIKPAHANRLLPLIVELLERTGTRWEEIDLIAVGTGPGTFTGLRIGIATARALARALAIPLVGVSTLHALALNAEEVIAGEPHLDAVLAVLDARRGEVFAAGWSPSELGHREPRLLAPRAIAPEGLAEIVPGLGKSTLAIGDGAVEFRAVLERSGASVPDEDSELHRVFATSHCRLAGNLRASAPDEIQPEYLRLPDAEIARRAACNR